MAFARFLLRSAHRFVFSGFVGSDGASRGPSMKSYHKNPFHRFKAW